MLKTLSCEVFKVNLKKRLAIPTISITIGTDEEGGAPLHPSSQLPILVYYLGQQQDSHPLFPILINQLEAAAQ